MPSYKIGNGTKRNFAEKVGEVVEEYQIWATLSDGTEEPLRTYTSLKSAQNQLSTAMFDLHAGVLSRTKAEPVHIYIKKVEYTVSNISTVFSKGIKKVPGSWYNCFKII